MVLKTQGEIELMDEANGIVHRVLDGIEQRIAPGVTTAELDRWAEETIRAAGAVPAFLNYRGYPGDAVHLGQRRDRPRDPGGSRARRGRHRRCRLWGAVPGLLR